MKPLALSCFALLSPLAIAEVRIEAQPVVSGYAPEIRVAGLARRQTVRIHLFRMFKRWDTDDPAKRGIKRRAEGADRNTA